MSTTSTNTTNTTMNAPTVYTPNTSTNIAGNANPAGATLNEQSFLQLMTTELQNQDPTSPMSDGAMVAEMAQFSSLNEQTSINTNTTSQLSLTQMSTGASMIGATVTSSQTDSSGNPITGVVSSASVTNGVVNVNVNGTDVPITSVMQIQ